MSQHREVVVIGAGQTGLAIGWHLARQGRDFTILDAAAEPAAAWRSRWDSLRLFTPARYDSLPGRQFPADADTYPAETRSSTTSPTTHATLNCPSSSTVRSASSARPTTATRSNSTTGHTTPIRSSSPTGPFQNPRLPANLADGLDPGVVQLHSSEYRRPEDVPAGRVLVVGAGNSGYQIAEDLSADPSRQVHLSIGTRQTPLPARIFGQELFGLLKSTGLMNKTVGSRVGQRLKSRDTLIGSSNRRAKRHGIELHTRARSAAGTEVGFDDGASLTVDTVIWATGFDTDHSWIDIPVFDPTGRVLHDRGVTASLGLYFLGLPWLHTRGSALLGWVKDDARHLAGRIASTTTVLASNRRTRNPALTPRKAIPA